jgi:starch synthase
MNQKLRVIYVSPEISPFAKSGQMADVASSLPKYLSSLGMEVSLFMPKYRKPEIESLPMELVMRDLLVPVGGKKAKANVFRSELGKHDIYFIDNPIYFWRDNVYGIGEGDYLDNDERFTFFNRAVLEFLLKTKTNVDIIHCNSWPTALIPVFLKTHYSHKSLFKKVATVLTIHNIAYQGEFPPETLALTGLNWNYFNPKQLSFNGKFNFLKAGLIFSDVINTVSTAYKREIQTAKHGFGLEGILKKRKDVFFSIRNGLDYEMWNPETDPYIVTNYSPSNLKAKKKCKIDLIKEFGLSLSSKTPLMGIVSYLSSQKGFDILLEAADEIMKMNVGLVVLGKGDEKYENRFLDLHKKYPRKIAVKFEINPALAHKVIAGADIFLSPSLYEPCGLNQLRSFKYGTVPVVRATGGLGETVKSFSRGTLDGNGFVFKKFSSRELLKAVKKALGYYGEPELWQTIMKAGLKENFSWESAAKKYAKLYQNALQLKRGG